MYADLDFWLALLKGDDWLGDRAEDLLAEHRDGLKVSLATFIEIARQIPRPLRSGRKPTLDDAIHAR